MDEDLIIGIDTGSTENPDGTDITESMIDLSALQPPTMDAYYLTGIYLELKEVDLTILSDTDRKILKRVQRAALRCLDKAMADVYDWYCDESE